MDIEVRLAAIEEKQNQILDLLINKEVATGKAMTLKEAARYAGYSPDHFRRLAVEQHLIPFVRPSGQQKGKILFHKADLDRFLGEDNDKQPKQPGRRRKSKNIKIW
ncbi:helix-turn-helix domain-containing protein [Desulfobulbus sp.]|uniref:helix-turn-helix domain-containing protein n=1 Tax=Desulfobulbus sp. TaxID=895 RepID=UPI0027B908B5|nr:helix-turn-helix domain-containing protein [Desulfobulbus sp.]